MTVWGGIFGKVGQMKDVRRGDRIGPLHVTKIGLAADNKTLLIDGVDSRGRPIMGCAGRPEEGVG